MHEDSSVQLQGLLDRVRQGEPAARRLLLERACARLRRLAGRMLHGSFPDLARRHEVDSVVHETWVRLLQALERTEPASVNHFFNLAAQKIRQVLLDMARSERRRGLHEVAGSSEADGAGQGPTVVNGTYDPARLALWTEFHEKVATLGEAERRVFEMHYYLDLPQAEIARLLGLHPRKVSYLWIAATEALGEGLDALG
jgi:RNA polymerase sigma factor (sigma-70 family)